MNEVENGGETLSQLIEFSKNENCLEEIKEMREGLQNLVDILETKIFVPWVKLMVSGKTKVWRNLDITLYIYDFLRQN